MSQLSQSDLVENLVRRRARIATALGVLFVTTQASTLSWTNDWRLVSRVQAVVWLIWALTLLFVLAVGGGLVRLRAVRLLMNDETTKDHRIRAMSAGFWSATCSALILYVLNYHFPFQAGEVLRLVITATLSVALLRFGYLERRALGDA